MTKGSWVASEAKKSRAPDREAAAWAAQPASSPATADRHHELHDGIPIKVIGKVGRILDVFRREGAELALGNISSAAGIELSTTSRLVTSLVHVGMLRYDTMQRLYSPGLLVLELSRVVLNRFSFRELAHRELIALAAETGWQCYLAVADESDDRSLMYIDAVSTATPELSEIGQRRPLHSTATGKVLLAFNGIPVDDWRLNGSTPSTHTDAEELGRELAEARTKGFAISLEEEQIDLCSAAAPIYDGEGRVLAALGVGTTAATFSANSQRIISAVLSKARGISSAIGLSDSGYAR